jgi:hypothetical protein
MMAAATWPDLHSKLPTALAAGQLRVTEEQVFLVPESKQERLQIIEQISIRNSGSRTLDVVLSLPSGARGVQVAGTRAGSAVVSGGQLRLSAWARPGTRVLTVNYWLPFRAQQEVQLTLHTPYPVDLAHLYLPIGDSALSAAGLLTTTQTVSIAGTPYRVFTRPGIPAGDDWSVSVQQLPTPTRQSENSGLPVIGRPLDASANALQALANLALAALVFVLGLIGVHRQSQSRRLNQEEALYLAWEDLERNFQEGHLEEVEYRRRREQLKARLVGLKVKG